MVDYSKYFPIEEYYDKVVVPINKRFKITKSGKRICPLHDDINPSFGLVHNKNGEFYHCFGCNAWVNVIEFHKRIQSRYFNRVVNEENSVRELCKIFNVNYTDLPKQLSDYENSSDKSIRKQVALRKELDRYSLYDFNSDFLAGKMEGKGIPYFNRILIQLIDSKKDA